MARLPLNFQHGSYLFLGVSLVMVAVALVRVGIAPMPVASAVLHAETPVAAPGELVLAASEGPGDPGDTMPKAQAGYLGTAAPGARIVLTSDGSRGENLRFRWVQTQGPPVGLETPDRPTTGLIVPQEASALGFTLVAAGAGGVETAALLIPVAQSAPPAVATLTLLADAGDDQLAVVGRRVNLSGVLSEPRGQLGYRWIQVGGPKVRLFIEAEATYSFVPHLPGVYRFALVVAAGRTISEPDEVSVSVASPSALPAGSPAKAEVEEMPEAARRLLASVAGGGELSANLAEVFDGVADRMDLYHSAAEMFQEMSRRLDAVVPSEPGARGVWAERVFTPLTSRLVSTFLAEGLDLRKPESQALELTLSQRARMAECFREAAEGFRSLKASR